ncbi:MAG: hypothetical protein AB7V18_19460 [Pyrinomonadaceae bacterium]
MTPESSSDDVYSQAFDETMTDDAPATNPEPEGTETPVETAEPESAEEPSGLVLTYSQTEALKRAQLDPALLAAMPREQVDAFVSRLIENQSAQDRLGAELARLKKTGQPAQEPPEETEDEELSDFAQKIQTTFSSLTDAYDDSILPLGNLLTEMDQRFSQVGQNAALVPAMAELMSDIVLDMTLDQLKADYPSLKSPEARQKVSERFWTEWKTGAYSKLEKPLRQQIREAAMNAAKVTFINTSEQAAVTNLVQQNRARVQSQPKVGPSKAPPRPKTVEDIYDDAFDATLGKEMSRA